MPDTTTTTGGGTDWGSIISGLISGWQATQGTAGKDATTAANRADPWGAQRGQYQTQLNDFMKDPGAATFNDPAFKAARDQGLEGVARTMGAAGMGSSGNNAAALYKYGDTFAYDAENNKYKQLADLAGVNAGSPAAAGAILAQGNNNQNANTAAGVSSLINALTAAGIPQGIISAISKAFGGGGSGGMSGGGNVVTNPGDPNYIGPPEDPNLIGPPTDPNLIGPPTDPFAPIDPLPTDPGFDIGSLINF